MYGNDFHQFIPFFSIIASMCGIAGYVGFREQNDVLKDRLPAATATLDKRGPDNQSNWNDNHVGLGHTRLSILDTSEVGNQPMWDQSHRYVLIFNGEIYNYKALEASLGELPLISGTDTEVLLYLLIKEGAACLDKLNGFFALAFYDTVENSLIIARDRIGIKPLHYFQSDDFLAFGSEMKALLEFPIERKLNHQALHWYMQLNYLPGTLSMIDGVQKLEPGHFLKIENDAVSNHRFATEDPLTSQLNYSDAQETFVDLLEASVQARLMADVPLGSFLSGGTDSSAVVALASKHAPNLSTFSIGYSDNPFFDETQYAELVAQKFMTNHTTFKLSNDDLLSDLNHILDYIDEPFADSSAIPTYILSKHVSGHVKVALSGDGADELFGGYYKHQALARALNPSPSDGLVKSLNPLVSMLPQSRSGKLANLTRRLDKFGKLQKMSAFDRYWFLASLTPDAENFLCRTTSSKDRASFMKQFLPDNPNMTDYLKADQQVVLVGDMLTKVDLMSMTNSLEVRVPFLDRSVVNFANSLSANFKVNASGRKRIVQDAFKEILPKVLYQRPKKGFEVPLLQWMQKELLAQLDAQVFNNDKLEAQGVFEPDEVVALRKKLLSSNPGDVHGTLWAIFVFQKWYDKYMA